MDDRRYEPICQPPQEWKQWVDYLSMGLHGRSRWRLPVLMVAMIMANGRRTVTSWLRAAGVTIGYQQFYWFIASVGRRTGELAMRMLELMMTNFSGRVTFALDDTPTPRYGPHVEGAGLHRNPTKTPDDHKYIYGHVWVVLAWVVRHRYWHTIALPIWASLYIKKKDIPKLALEDWNFHTKLELALQMLRPIAARLIQAGREVWIVADGAYFYRTFVRPAIALGVTVFSRLRIDAALRTLPTRSELERSRGRRIYGTGRISLAKRAAHPKGWSTLECVLYGGRTVTKTIKTFLATYEVVGGVVRVVLVKEAGGWEAFVCTNPDVSPRDILEVFADRSSIEQLFADVKEVWGAAQQQVRNVWCNIGCFHLNLWSHTLTEMWAWRKRKKEICDRRDSPWDVSFRRPSHRDRRKSLRRFMIETICSAAQQLTPESSRIQELLKILYHLSP